MAAQEATLAGVVHEVRALRGQKSTTCTTVAGTSQPLSPSSVDASAYAIYWRGHRRGYRRDHWNFQFWFIERSEVCYVHYYGRYWARASCKLGRIRWSFNDNFQEPRQTSLSFCIMCKTTIAYLASLVHFIFVLFLKLSVSAYSLGIFTVFSVSALVNWCLLVVLF